MPKGQMPFRFASYIKNYDNYSPDEIALCPSYCTSHDTFTFYTNTDIRIIMINTSYVPTIKDFTFNNIVFNTAQTLPITLTFYQADYSKYADSSIDVNMLPIQIPPTLMVLVNSSMDESQKMLQYLNLQTFSDKTDSNGNLNVSLSFNGPLYGLYVISFTAGSANTFPLFFKTDFPIGNVEIKTQPAPNSTLPHVADVFVSLPRVYVSDINGQPLKNVVVTTLFDDGCACSNGTTIAMMDQYTYGCATNSQLTSYISTISSIYSKVYITDANGMVTFTQFGIMDVATKACVRFRFAVGEPGLSFISLASDQVCVINDYTYEVSSFMSSKVADNQAFGVPALVTIKRSKQGQYDLHGFITIAAFAKYIDGTIQADRASSSDRVLTNNYCQFYSG